MKKKLIWILALFLIPCSFASPEIQLQSSISLGVYQGMTNSTNINVTNVGNETAYNLSATQIANIQFNNLPTELAPNETKQFTITANAFQINQISTIAFYQRANTTSVPETKEIKVNSSGFNPFSIEIKQGDSILWRNLESSPHSATNIDNSFNYQIPALGTAQHQFNSINSVNYYDTANGRSGSINVISNIITLLTHDSSKDKTITITTSVLPQPTNLELELIPTSATMNYNDILTGVLYIRNTGSITALNVNLNLNWTVFSENNFNIDPSQQKIIFFNVTPSISGTNDTNKNYPLQLTARGTNTNEFNETIDVFINQHDFTEITINGTKYIYVPYTYEEMQQLCKDGKITCPTNNVTTIIYQPEPNAINLTDEQYYQLFGNFGLLNGSLQRSENRDLTTASDITEIKNIIIQQAEDLKQLKEDDAKYKKNRKMIDWFFGILVTTILIGGAIFVLYQRNKAKAIQHS